MLKNTFKSALLIAAISVMAACSNNDDDDAPAPVVTAPAKASGLAYSNPAASGWRLEQDASSTATRLVLNVVGPADSKVRGIGFNVQADTRVKFGGFDNGSYANDTGVFNLKNSAPDEYTYPIEPVFFASGLLPNNVLTTGIFQKDRRLDSVAVDTALVQIAVEFDATLLKDVNAGETLSLNVIKSRIIPDDIGGTGATESYAALMEKAHLDDISISVGMLKTK